MNKPRHVLSDFSSFSTWISDALGQFSCFVVALFFVIVWIISGPLFHFSDTWQLVINTITTIITFLMVFLIQHTQNRDMKILNLKLNELIRSHKAAHNSSIDLAKLSDQSLKKLEKEYEKICKKSNA